MGKRVLMILVVVMLLILIAAGAVLYIYVLKPDDPVTIGEIYVLPETFMTDLASGNHIRVEVRLELENKKMVEEVERRKPQVIDGIYSILRSKTKSELSGSEGQELLRNEIEIALNELFTTGELLRVYFYQIVID